MQLETDKNNIQQGADIVHIISAYFLLTKSRFVLKGNCPFHDDSNNSFMVSPEKNLFKCFGCGIEGGPVEFIIAIENKKGVK